MLSSSTRVLVVDDEASLRKALRASLSATGFVVEEARTGDEAIGAVRDRSFDLVLLDISMPGITGFETCRRIRANSARAGIVMVTVRDAEDDKVRALESGADDYVSKPFRLRELVARLRAVLRRTRLPIDQPGVVLQVGDLELDFDRRMLRRSGNLVHLSPKEYDLLALLMKNPGVPLPHTKILREIWGAEYGNELEYLRSYVKALRKKIENDPANPRYILTEPWVGYRFCSPADTDSAVVLSSEA